MNISTLTAATIHWNMHAHVLYRMSHATNKSTLDLKRLERKKERYIYIYNNETNEWIQIMHRVIFTFVLIELRLRF